MKVWIAPNNSTSSQTRAYHTHECHAFPSDPMEKTKTQAERMGLDICGACDGVSGTDQNYNFSYQAALRQAAKENRGQ